MDGETRGGIDTEENWLMLVECKRCHRVARLSNVADRNVVNGKGVVCDRPVDNSYCSLKRNNGGTSTPAMTDGLHPAETGALWR